MIFNERKTGCYFFYHFCLLYSNNTYLRSHMQQFFVFILILTFWLKIAVMRIDFLRKHEQLKKKTYSSSPFVCASWETVIVGWVGLSPDLDTRPRYCQLINYLCCMSLPTVFVSLFLPVLCIWTLLKGQCNDKCCQMRLWGVRLGTKGVSDLNLIFLRWHFHLLHWFKGTVSREKLTRMCRIQIL